MSLTSWFLVSSGGTRHRLPREMIFVGRDDCELMLQSRSVDKQHAVINYDSATDEHKVKDLGSLNGTFVNDVRIQEQMYITLKMDDKLRFGYDTNLFTVVRGKLRVPEEALKHEKFTSQLQLTQKTSEGEGSKAARTKAAEAKAAEAGGEGLLKCAEAQKLDDKMSADMAALHRGTPLYGQPSWWGDDDADDENSFNQETKAGGKKLEGGASGENKEPRKAEEQGGNEEALISLCREPSYFEIPTKEFQQAAPMAESTIHEIPTKDTEGAHAAAAGHASFTIEFDDNTPGKVTIKDHMTKFNPDQRPRSKKSPPQGGKELSTLQATMIAAESKVSDWLAQNNPPMARRESTEDDSKSIKSDVPIHLKRLKGSKHEDGTQSDSENGASHRHTSKRAALEEHVRVYQGPKGLTAASAEGKGIEGTLISRTAFMVEFFDEDNPRKHRSYSFTQNGAAAMAALAGEGPCPPPSPSVNGLVPMDCKGVPSPLATPPSSKPHRKQKSGDPSLVRSSASVGQQTSPNEEPEKPPKATGSVEKENEDDQSDKGTYTIELENRNPEEEEARRMIDKVFGIEESQDHSRPVVPEQQKGTIKDWASSRTVEMRKSPFGTAAFIDSETLPEGPVSVGSPRWVSQWASLAANHSGHEPDELRSESPYFGAQEKEADVSESGISVQSITSATSTSSHGERKRRTLPQLPTEDKVTAKAVKGTTSLGLRSEIGEKQDTEPQEKETSSRLSHKGREADRTSRTAHKAPSESQIVFPPSQQKEKSDSAKGTSVVKQARVKIQQQEQKSSQSQRASSKLAPGTKPPVSAEKSREVSSKHGNSVQKTGADTDHNEEDRRRRSDSPRSQVSKVSESEKESGKPLVRQGSFTIEKPSTNVPLELIPRINKQMASPLTQGRERSDSVGTDSSMDTTVLLKDTEAVMAFLEAKLKEENKLDDGTDTPSYHLDNSISPESDVDTASTISLVTGDTERKSAQKRRTLSSLYKEKSTVKSPSLDHSKNAASARERLEKRTKSRTTDSRTEARRSVQASARARQPSLDLTDDDQTFSLPHFTILDILSSDQETYSGRSHGRAQFTSTDELLHSKLEASKTAKTKTLQASSTGPCKPATLPRPRPTRASLLRKARLGETSDNELTDADKVSVASEVSTTSSTSKPPSGRKTPSRIDMLAQPRRIRLGSLSARSDSEATVNRSSASSRTPDSAFRSGLRPSSATDGKIVPRMRANSVSKLPDIKSKISFSTHSSPSVKSQPTPDTEAAVEDLMANARWRRLPPDYASTSEDEFGSNRNSPKHGRLRPGTTLRSTRLQTTASPGPGGVVLKHRMREQEEYIRDWTAHSEEIARLFPCVRRISQDLAKDLATLAREIHDVAGEIDSESSPSTVPSTTVSTAATTPGSVIDTREELVDRVFDESLNFRKISPALQNKAPEINGRPVELRPRTTEAPDPQAAIRRRTWSRDEAVLDSLLLTSVSQLSSKIRQAVDKTAGKIRILFKDKDRNWEEIENKLRAESDMPLLKTSNKEISSILLELKRVEKQLQVINVMVDPDGTLDALSSLGLTSPVLPKQSSSPSSRGARAAAPPPGAPELRTARLGLISASSELDSVESNRDFSLHYNRFNPSGEEGDSVVHE
ncbi:centrosomal protein of 170 kDa-like isoform X3 [Acipenser ruthenus]|uniref:centrosomal protein of 170 kDa-like isoform X3 n=1 Tax=Acipenser ruthenus TaxID=7906 RepID=UPI00274238FA|nr:centrosomal protein of 170 kDa-like isoform X3 [Acipenser ruthenus]